jgi:hypothetical protein
MRDIVRVAWYCSGFVVSWRQVTSHYCLPIAYDWQVYVVLSLSYRVNVLYTFNTCHTLRMACHICI